MENLNGRGVGFTIMEIWGHGGKTHFGNSEGKGGLKYGSRPWYGTDIFWNRPIGIITKSHFAAWFCLFHILVPTFKKYIG